MPAVDATWQALAFLALPFGRPSPTPWRPFDSEYGQAARGRDDASAGPRPLLARQLSFRFALLYVALYVLPFPFYHIPGLARPAAWLLEWQGRFVHAIGVSFFQLPDELPSVGGCGDRADHFVTVPVKAALALGGALLWSALDRPRNRPIPPRVAYWATVCLHYYLAHTLLGSDGAWSWLAVEEEPYASLKPRVGPKRAIALRADTAAHLIQLRLDRDDTKTRSVDYTTPEPGVLELNVRSTKA